MKRAIILFFLLATFLGYSQTNDSKKIVVDTIEINYRIKDIIDITSYVPQITGAMNSVAKSKINADLKNYFRASRIKLDSATYVKNLLADYNLKDLDEYFEMTKFNDTEDESFNVEYISENILNVCISYQTLPYRGQYQFFFESVIYDLRTGNKLRFNDFFSINTDALPQLVKTEGYYFKWSNELMELEKIKLTPTNGFEVDSSMVDAPLEEIRCTKFYFNNFEGEIYLMLKATCEGPYLSDYGIPISKLKSYIKHFEFKNMFRLWGKDIRSIIGHTGELGRTTEFEEYTITNGGGYLLSKDKSSSDVDFGIQYSYSPSSLFYLFTKYEKKDSIKIATIIDVLEIRRTLLTPNKMVTPFCETEKGFDSELFAIVDNNDANPEHFTKILKAWRANRKTEKFELIDRERVKKCANESSGI